MDDREYSQGYNIQKLGQQWWMHPGMTPGNQTGYALFCVYYTHPVHRSFHSRSIKA
jgi:hypothetical protein